MMEEALEGLGVSNLSGLTDEQRREGIQYMATWSMRVIDWFAPNYGEVLAEMCQDKKDVDLWEHILDNPSEVEKSYWALIIQRKESL